MERLGAEFGGRGLLCEVRVRYTEGKWRRQLERAQSPAQMDG